MSEPICHMYVCKTDTHGLLHLVYKKRIQRTLPLFYHLPLTIQYSLLFSIGSLYIFTFGDSARKGSYRGRVSFLPAGATFFFC